VSLDHQPFLRGVISAFAAANVGSGLPPRQGITPAMLDYSPTAYKIGLVVREAAIAVGALSGNLR
jgi:hypothetical protein